jgi:hypothetical protein
MAIEFEENKKSGNWMTIGIVAFLVIVLLLGSYYLFFTSPELIDVVVPSGFEQLGQISQVKFDPKKTIDSSAFKGLKDYSAPISIPAAGRANPFKPFQ